MTAFYVERESRLTDLDSTPLAEHALLAVEISMRLQEIDRILETSGWQATAITVQFRVIAVEKRP